MRWVLAKSVQVMSASDATIELADMQRVGSTNCYLPWGNFMRDAKSGRGYLWMDLVRGLAIVLVIAWHAQAIPALNGYEVPRWLVELNTFFLPFRMPSLMFLSGMLLPRSLTKGTLRYYVGKLRYVGWPYVIWAAIFLGVFSGTQAMLNPRSWIATDYLWFLFFVGCYYCIAPVFKKLPHWILPILMLLASIPLDTQADGLTRRFLYMGAFFFLGNLAAHSKGIFERLIGNVWVVSVCLVAATVVGMLSISIGVEHQGQYAPLVICGIVGISGVANRIANWSFLSPLLFMGVNSIVFYVAHFPIILAIVRATHGTTGINLLIPAVFLAAMLVGFVLSSFRRFIPVKWLFELPSPQDFARVKASGGPVVGTAPSRRQG